MNTQFPNRIPTVINNSTTGNSTTSSESSDPATKTFREKIVEIFKIVIDSLHKISDYVANFFRGGGAKPQQQQTQREERAATKDRAERGIFFKKVTSGFTLLSDAWKKGIANLQSSVDQTASSIGSTIGGVFGQGLFGRLLGNIITKSLEFAVSKVLLGFVVSNFPMIAVGFLILAAIGTIIYFSKEIWEGIKWVGRAIDQAVADIIDALPWTKSKYSEAAEGISDFGVLDEAAVKAYYGDSVNGRNEMLEDFRRAKEDKQFRDELIQKIMGKRDEMRQEQQDVINWINGDPRRHNMTLAQEIRQEPLPPYFYNPEEQNMTPINPPKEEPLENLFITPISNNNTITEFPNFFGSNVSMMYPMSSINGNNLNYTPIGLY